MVSPRDLSREEDRDTGGDERQTFSPEPFLCVQYHVAFFSRLSLGFLLTSPMEVSKNKEEYLPIL